MESILPVYQQRDWGPGMVKCVWPTRCLMRPCSYLPAFAHLYYINYWIRINHMHFIIIAVFNTVCLMFLLLVVEIMFFWESSVTTLCGVEGQISLQIWKKWNSFNSFQHWKHLCYLVWKCVKYFLHVVCQSQISSYCRSRLTKCLTAYENGCRFIIQLVVSVTFKCDEPRLKMSHEGAAQVWHFLCFICFILWPTTSLKYF